MVDTPSGTPSISDGATPSIGLADTGVETGTAADTTAAPVVPGSPDAYALDLPADFEGVDGFEFSLGDDDPMLGEVVGEARALAHELGLSQDQFSKMVALGAKRDLAEFKALQAASKAQMKSLGANGPARVDAVTKFLVGHLGEDHAKSLLGVLFSKTQVEAFEKIMTTFTRRGVPAPTPGGAQFGNQPDVDKLGEIRSPAQRFLAAMAMTKPRR